MQHKPSNDHETQDAFLLGVKLKPRTLVHPHFSFTPQIPTASLNLKFSVKCKRTHPCTSSCGDIYILRFSEVLG